MSKLLYLERDVMPTVTNSVGSLTKMTSRVANQHASFDDIINYVT